MRTFVEVTCWSPSRLTSEYGHRGFDLAALLSEWGKQGATELSLTMSDDRVLQEISQVYIDISVDYCSRADIARLFRQSKEQLGCSMSTAHAKEVKVMILVHGLFVATFLVTQQSSAIAGIPFDA